MEKKYRKRYVDVIAEHDEYGNIRPLTIKWDDDRSFQVDRIIAVEHRASLKAGGAGIRYTCKIEGVQTHLFLEETKWFVEEKLSHRQ